MYFRRCLDCSHWCGTKYSTWGLCSYIAADLCPSLLEFINSFGWRMKVPIDPHDVKYFPEWVRINKMMKSIQLPESVVRTVEKERDLVLLFQDSVVIGEKTQSSERVYFHTNRDYKSSCNYFKERRAMND